MDRLDGNSVSTPRASWLARKIAEWFQAADRDLIKMRADGSVIGACKIAGMT
jgi:hypothetical protein